MSDTDGIPPDDWRPIPGFEGHYEVSPDGQVRSLKRVVLSSTGRRFTVKERLLRPSTGQYYPHVILMLNGTRYTRKLHSLVAEAFHGPRPFPGACVRHLDGNPSNNTVDNLCWGTNVENMYDAVRHGNNRNANKTHCKHGHEYTAENTLVRLAGKNRRPHRSCRACYLARKKQPGQAA